MKWGVKALSIELIHKVLNKLNVITGNKRTVKIFRFQFAYGYFIRGSKTTAWGRKYSVRSIGRHKRILVWPHVIHVGKTKKVKKQKPPVTGELVT